MTRVDRCLSVQDLQQHARRYLPRVIYDYVEGGADDEEALHENVGRIRAIKLRPRYLVDVGSRSQEVVVFGKTYRSPFGIGPMGMLGMVRPGGDLTLAEVAHASGIPFVLSGASNDTTEAVAAKAPGSWLNYYPCNDLGMEHGLLSRAAGAGVETLVVTVDVPLHSKRERNMRSGWVRPYKPTPAVMLEAIRHPAWVLKYLRHGLPVMANIQRYAPPGSSARELTSFYASQVPTRHQWSMVERLRERWPGNLVLKGILAPEDAQLAAAAGVDGVIVSNHGGRQLDRSVAAIDALPEVAAAVGAKMVVMFDSGIRRGSDIAVALALGARLCFVGRAAAYGLAAFGAPGAQRCVDILRGELDLTLGQVGCPKVAELDARYLWRQRKRAAFPPDPALHQGGLTMSIDQTSALHTFANHIGGKRHPAASGKTFKALNPTTGKEWGVFADSDAADIDHAVSAATAALNGPWGKLSNTRRGRLLMAWGEKLAEHAEAIGRLETAQNGKLLAEMKAQATVAKDWLYYYGGLADKIEGRVIPVERASILNYTVRERLGVVGVIVPWNSPTFLTMMSCAPALAAGNTIVLKPSEVTSASAFELVRLAEEAGMPPGVLNVVTGGRVAGEALVDHPGVAKISFTGSDAGGRAIAARAGRRLASCTLELGGKSPNIVFGDARVDNAVAGILSGIFAAAGQTCVAGSRAYIHESVYDEIVSRLVQRARQIKLGDPLLPDSQMGPVATIAQLQKDETMVRNAVQNGARVLTGGERTSVKGLEGGLFFHPTILEGADHAHEIMQQEVFGPVLNVVKFRDDEEVVAKANGTPFGLAAGIWTRDFQRAHQMARRLAAGTVWINTYRALTFNSPFGGFKDSGIGRVNGIEAVDQFLQTKSVWCELSDEIQDPFVLKL